MTRVAHYGSPYPAITSSNIPEGPAREKEAYLGGTYQGVFELSYDPRQPTPTEAAVALSYAVQKFEREHDGVKVVYASLDHPTTYAAAAGAVPSCTFQFTVHHHSPFPVTLLLWGIAAAIAAGIAYGTSMAVAVITSVLIVVFLIAVGDYVVNHLFRGPTIKCPKCGYDLDYLGVEALIAHWRAEHSDQDEPDWDKMAEEYKRSGWAGLIFMGVVGVGAVLGSLVAFKYAWGKIGKPEKEKEKEIKGIEEEGYWVEWQ